MKLLYGKTIVPAQYMQVLTAVYCIWIAGETQSSEAY